MSDYFGKETPKLGFGLMRLPKKGLHTDIEQVKHMVDLFMEAGFTYFDTAYVYMGSEAAIRKALVERYPRESYTLATKLNAMMMAPTEKAAKNQFYTSLERTGAGYFDYYLLYAMMDGSYVKYDKFHLWDFVAEQKAKGLVKHMGFSFHAGPPGCWTGFSGSIRRWILCSCRSIMRTGKIRQWRQGRIMRLRGGMENQSL